MGFQRFFVLLAVLTPLAHAAWVGGAVWDAVEMAPAQGFAVEVNTTPMQRDITGADGSYFFEVGTGEYELVVKRVNNNELETVASERVVIPDNGNYTLDLLVFYDDLELIDIGEEEFDFEQGDSEGADMTSYSIVLAGALLGLGLYLFTKNRRTKKEPAKEEPQDVSREEPKELAGELPRDLRQLVDTLRSHDGRMTQKELRKLMPLSEAKVSLMIAELESMGVVKKIKKGRGNILILKEKNRQ